jgi:polyisoprenoid-binding protein YceI
MIVSSNIDGTKEQKLSTTTITTIPTGTYTIDPTHSNVGFEIRHLGITTVRGGFRTFEGTIDANADAPRLVGSVEVASVDTGEVNRDGHLQAPDFFDAQHYPQITFHSTATDVADDGEIRLRGEITIKGVTKPIELNGTLSLNGEDPWGNERIGLELETKIDRRDFELTYNQTLPNGNLLLSNEVKLLVGVSATKQA